MQADPNVKYSECEFDTGPIMPAREVFRMACKDPKKKRNDDVTAEAAATADQEGEPQHHANQAAPADDRLDAFAALLQQPVVSVEGSSDKGSQQLTMHASSAQRARTSQGTRRPPTACQRRSSRLKQVEAVPEKAFLESETMKAIFEDAVQAENMQAAGETRRLHLVCFSACFLL